jgi:hypothetical protein
MTESAVVAAGAVGVVLSLVGTGLYLLDVRRGCTTPHRGSWLVWGVIAVIAALAHGATGGGWSLAVLCVQAAGTLAVLAAALRHGSGWFTPLNVAMFGVATLGVVGWLSFTDPIAATACAALADGAGLVAMMPKVWAEPASETLATYALAGVTGALACVAVAGWELNLILFPAYFCLGNSATAGVIVHRRRVLRRQLNPDRWRYLAQPARAPQHQ